MRPIPTILTVVLMAVMWLIVLRMIGQRRARMGAGISPRRLRCYRLQDAGLILATVGVTWFSVWLITDGGAVGWLHLVSGPAALIFIALGGVVAGYAGWLGGS